MPRISIVAAVAIAAVSPLFINPPIAFTFADPTGGVRIIDQSGDSLCTREGSGSSPIMTSFPGRQDSGWLSASELEPLLQFFSNPSSPRRVRAVDDGGLLVHKSDHLSLLGLHKDRVWDDVYAFVSEHVARSKLHGQQEQGQADGNAADDDGDDDDDDDNNNAATTMKSDPGRAPGNHAARTVYLVRHGEGHHNAAEREHGKEYWETVEALKEEYFDSDLNDAGKQQAIELASAVGAAKENKGLEVELILVSPLTRAIETARLGFPHAWENTSVPVVANEWCREHFGKNTPDRRRSVPELESKYPRVSFEHFLVSPEDTLWTPIRESDEEVNARVELFFHWLMLLPARYSRVAVVGHSSWMAHAIEWLGKPYHWPRNCEVCPVVVDFDGSHLVSGGGGGGGQRVRDETEGDQGEGKL